MRMGARYIGASIESWERRPNANLPVSGQGGAPHREDVADPATKRSKPQASFPSPRAVQDLAVQDLKESYARADQDRR